MNFVIDTVFKERFPVRGGVALMGIGCNFIAAHLTRFNGKYIENLFVILTRGNLEFLVWFSCVYSTVKIFI